MNFNISDAHLDSNCRNNSFGCVKVPEGCSEYETGDKNIPCALAVSWIGTSSNTYAVHLHAYMPKLPKQESYIALGFPPLSLMSPAPVVACDTYRDSVRVSHITSCIPFSTPGPRCFGTQRSGKTNLCIIVPGLQVI